MVQITSVTASRNVKGIAACQLIADKVWSGNMWVAVPACQHSPIAGIRCVWCARRCAAAAGPEAPSSRPWPSARRVSGGTRSHIKPVFKRSTAIPPPPLEHVDELGLPHRPPSIRRTSTRSKASTRSSHRCPLCRATRAWEWCGRWARR